MRGSARVRTPQEFGITPEVAKDVQAAAIKEGPLDRPLATFLAGVIASADVRVIVTSMEGGAPAYKKAAERVIVFAQRQGLLDESQRT